MATDGARYEGGNLVASVLAERGVERIFSVSGGPLNSLYSATVESPVRIIHTRHEGGAGFMAEGTARITGIPGVAAVTLGPGVTNVLTPMLTARLGGVPLLVLAGQAATRTVDRGAGMSFDPLPVVSPIAKWAARVLDTERIPEYLDAAWRHMLSGRPGSVFLEIPADVLSGPASPQALERRRSEASFPPQPSKAAVDALRAALAQSRRPIVIVGDDVYWTSSGEALGEAVDRHHLPFVLARLARGVVDERHPLSAGVAYVGANPALRSALAEADLVLLLGHDFEFDLDFGSGVNLEATVIQVHPDASLLGRNLVPDLAINAGADAVLEALSAGEAGWARDKAWVTGVTAAWRQERARIEAEAAAQPWPLHPVRLVEDVVASVPEDTVFVTSHGNIDFWADTAIEMRRPGRYLRAGQSGALGAEIPYGVAASLALPDAPVVVFVGDGGFAFSGLELETAARYGAHPIVVVADDTSWGAIALPQRRAYGVNVEMDLPRRDWAAVAAAIGGHGEIVSSPEDLRPAIERSLQSGLPSVIQVPIRSVESPYMAYTSRR